MRLTSPIRTERLTLETLNPNDLTSGYLSWVNDEEITRFLEIRFRKFTAQDLVDFVRAMNDSDDNLLLGVFANAKHIGNIKLGPIIGYHKRADIGLVFGREAWGQGYATEAIQAVTAYGLHTLGLHRITAGMYEKNIGSYKAFIKAGYTIDGRLKSYWREGDTWQDEIVLHRII